MRVYCCICEIYLINLEIYLYTIVLQYMYIQNTYNGTPGGTYVRSTVHGTTFHGGIICKEVSVVKLVSGNPS